MKRFRVPIPMLAVLALVVYGCQLADVTSDAEADADAIAAAVASPSDGMTQEAMDVGGYFFGSPAGSGSSKSLPSHVFPANHLRFFSGDLGSFSWNPATEAYERRRSDFDVILPGHSVHVDAVFVQVRFFISSDASGSSYQPVDFSSGFDPWVHSMTYHREVSGTSTNLITGTVTEHAAESDLVFTNIDTASGTVTIDGTRTCGFDRSFTNGRTVVGTINDTISDLVMTWKAETGTLSWDGTLAYVLDATVTRPNGTPVVRHQEGTIEFSGSSTFTVTVDGQRYRYRLSDGSRID
jgi:hypothetical protein